MPCSAPAMVNLCLLGRSPAVHGIAEALPLSDAAVMIPFFSIFTPIEGRVRAGVTKSNYAVGPCQNRTAHYPGRPR